MVRYIIILVIFLSSCASRHREVSVERQKLQEYRETYSTAAHVGELHLSSGFEGFNMSEFSSALSALNWTYSGNEDDTFRLEIMAKEDGYVAQMSGSGEASGGQTSLSSREAEYLYIEQKYDSLVFEFNAFKAQTENQLNSLSKSKEVTAKTTGLSIIGYMQLIVLLIVLFLAWRMKFFRW